MGDLVKFEDFAKSAGKYLNPTSYLTHRAGYETAKTGSLSEGTREAASEFGLNASPTAMRRADAAALSAAEKAKRDAEYSEEAAKGAERVKAKRRRGYASTLLTAGAGGSAPAGASLGSLSTTGNSTLLGG